MPCITKAALRLVVNPKTVLSILALGLIVAGCDDDVSNPLVLSIHPLYLESDADFDPSLVGKWRDEEGDVTFLFEQAANHEYKMTIREQEDSGQNQGAFDAHIVRLGGSWFLDIAPSSLQAGSEFYRAHFIRAHTIARIEIGRDTLHISVMAGGWLKRRFEDKSVDAAHETADGIVILTTSTEEVQDLVDRFANDDGAFPEPIDLHRVENEKEEE
jgi:hypothetical protein